MVPARPAWLRRDDVHALRGACSTAFHSRESVWVGTSALTAVVGSRTSIARTAFQGMRRVSECVENFFAFISLPGPWVPNETRRPLQFSW
ncbi:hypothetical protein V2G26_001219 [Clonostachys chloroleuca]